jgi:hypothetical protein
VKVNYLPINMVQNKHIINFHYLSTFVLNIFLGKFGKLSFFEIVSQDQFDQIFPHIVVYCWLIRLIERNPTNPLLKGHGPSYGWQGSASHFAGSSRD